MKYLLILIALLVGYQLGDRHGRRRTVAAYIDAIPRGLGPQPEANETRGPAAEARRRIAERDAGKGKGTAILNEIAAELDQPFNSIDQTFTFNEAGDL